MKQETTTKYPKTLNDLFDSLANWVQLNGFKVEFTYSAEYGGQIDYDLKTITINLSQPTECIVATIAHEAGHVSHYLEDKFLEITCSRRTRERKAYNRGWAILKEFDPDRRLMPLVLWLELGIDEQYL